MNLFLLFVVVVFAVTLPPLQKDKKSVWCLREWIDVYGAQLIGQRRGDFIDMLFTGSNEPGPAVWNSFYQLFSQNQDLTPPSKLKKFINFVSSIDWRCASVISTWWTWTLMKTFQRRSWLPRDHMWSFNLPSLPLVSFQFKRIIWKELLNQSF